MYEDFFGLRESPFSTQPDPRYAYPSMEHRVAVAKMKYAANQKRGLAVLTGPVGSGKTTTAHQLLEEWEADPTKRVAFLTSASDRLPAAFLRKVLMGFNVKPTRNESDNMRFLEHFLITEYKEGRHPILLIDEGQNVSSRNIDTIYEMTNFQTAQSKLITVVMLAQDNLPNKLERKDAFRSRIAVSGSLDPLTYEDTCSMIAHRLHTAGGKTINHYFTEGALIELYNTTKGIPRDVCILCDACFVNGYVHEQKPIDTALVVRSVDEMKRIKGWPVKETTATDALPATDDPPISTSKPKRPTSPRTKKTPQEATK